MQDIADPPLKEITAQAESGLTGQQVEELAASLLAQRKGLVERVREHLDRAINEQDATLPDEMDQASRDQEQAYLLKLADSERNLLGEIDAALARIEAGTYGVCEGSGEPIGFRRLQARPWARHSVAYKEELEREERGMSASRRA